MLGKTLWIWDNSLIYFLFINHLMKIYYGLDTVVLKLIETKMNNSSSLDIHQLVGKATCHVSVSTERKEWEPTGWSK